MNSAFRETLSSRTSVNNRTRARTMHRATAGCIVHAADVFPRRFHQQTYLLLYPYFVNPMCACDTDTGLGIGIGIDIDINVDIDIETNIDTHVDTDILEIDVETDIDEDTDGERDTDVDMT